jgi:UDP-N-acetylmuramate dehydrogenase
MKFQILSSKFQTNSKHKIQNSKINKLLFGSKKNVSLKEYTTFRIGGRARYFFEAKTKNELISVIKLAKELKLPFFILGGGSNLLINNKGFNGLVIKFGQPLSFYVSKGLEWAVGIPGTIQGAVWCNAGAFGKSMQDVVKEVEVFNAKTGKIKIFKNKDCQFSYRNSIFKKNKNLIILSVKIKSKKSDIKKIRQYLNHRKKTQPLSFPSAGSIFKNPKGFFAGKLIEECGLKGKRIGNVQISEKHANFIVNLGNGRAKDVIKLIKLIKEKVKKRFGITLKEEIEFL